MSAHEDPAGTATIDQLVWALALQCRPGDVVIVGVATPVAACAALLARELLVPGLTVLVGPSVQPLTHDLAAARADPATPGRLALGTYSQHEVLDLVQRGGVSLQFVSPLEVDGTGAINASRIPGGGRLPGSLALADTALCARRVVAYRARHSPRFLAPRVAFVTAPGRGPWRKAAGLPGEGVATVVTDRAVIDLAAGGAQGAPPGNGGRDSAPSARLVSVHGPGCGERAAAPAAVEQAVAGCGFLLDAAEPVAVTGAPPAEALRLLEEVIDPRRLRLLEDPAQRDRALAAWTELGSA